MKKTKPMLDFGKLKCFYICKARNAAKYDTLNIETPYARSAIAVGL